VFNAADSRRVSPAVAGFSDNLQCCLSQAAARHMIPRGYGKIVNIASLLSFQAASALDPVRPPREA
jgi:hypothetical protein